MRERPLILLLGAGLLMCGAIAAAGTKGGEGEAEKGKAVFAQQCVMCHNAATAEKKMGPGLKGLFKKDNLASGKKATEQNIRARIDNGGNGMPAYRDMLSPEERNNLIAYLKTL